MRLSRRHFLTTSIGVLAAASLVGAVPEANKSNSGGKAMKHELPPLPYDYNALEPYYDEETVRLHHDKHQAAYVAGLNKAEEELEKARAAGDFAMIQHWERQLAFHGSGNILHTLFFRNMAPKAGGEPGGALMEQIKTDFGSYESFKKQFSAAAVAVEGSGWAILGWLPDYKKLYILQAENHQKLTMWGITPLLALDVWEHAYYLKYQNRRADWVEAWWNLVNWKDVETRFTEAIK